MSASSWWTKRIAFPSGVMTSGQTIWKSLKSGRLSAFKFLSSPSRRRLRHASPTTLWRSWRSASPTNSEATFRGRICPMFSDRPKTKWDRFYGSAKELKVAELSTFPAAKAPKISPCFCSNKASAPKVITPVLAATRGQESPSPEERIRRAAWPPQRAAGGARGPGGER